MYFFTNGAYDDSTFWRKRLPDEIKFIEIKDGYIMKSATRSIQEARGILKNNKFSTERYFQFKTEDKVYQQPEPPSYSFQAFYPLKASLQNSLQIPLQ